jgi:hypothetical protein
MSRPIQSTLAQMSGRRRVRRIGPNVREEALAELELTVRESKEAGPNAKVRFRVIELGVEATGSSRATQQVTLTLDPRRRGVAGEPLTSGSSRPESLIVRTGDGPIPAGRGGPAGSAASHPRSPARP